MSKVLSGTKVNVIEMVQEAIESGEDVNVVDKMGNSPLFISIIKKNLEIVELLLENGANTNVVVQSYSPLLLSIEQGQEQIAKALINANADLNFRGHEGFTPLMAAVRDGHFSILKLLLSEGCDVLVKTDNGSTAIDIAKQLNQSECLALLEKHIGTHDYGINRSDLDKLVIINVDESEGNE